MSALTCCHPVVILSVERRTWVGGVPTYVGGNPTHPGPSLDARDDKSASFGTEDSALGPHPSALGIAFDVGELGTAFNGLACLDEDAVDDAVDGGLDLVLHLHRFEDEDTGALGHRRPLLDEHSGDAAGHEGADEATATHLVVTFAAAQRQRIDDLDMDGRGGEGDFVLVAALVMDERVLRAVLEAQGAEGRPGADEVRLQPAVAQLHAIAAA